MSDVSGGKPNQDVHVAEKCSHPGCTDWGIFGKERGRGVTEWRCWEHLADDYWDGREKPPAR